MKIYVLELENNKWYVGKTENVLNQVLEHIKTYNVIDIIYVTKYTEEKYKRICHKYGSNNLEYRDPRNNIGMINMFSELTNVVKELFTYVITK